MTVRGVCEFCGREVRQGESAAFRVRGWEIERKAGGANYIAGKERQPNRICHARCVEDHNRRERLGLRGQMSL
jgi:hypothetical protein